MNEKNPFTVTKLNTVDRGVFTYQLKTLNWIPENNDNPYSRCCDKTEYLVDKESWSLTNDEISLDYDDKRNKLNKEGDSILCLHSDNFCKPTVKLPYTTVWFPEETCLVFHWKNDENKWSMLY